MRHQWPAYSVAEVARRLPAFAQRKIRDLQALADDAEALGTSTFARQQKLEGQITNLSQRASTLDPNIDSETMRDLREQVADLRADTEKLQAERGKRMGIHGNATQCLAQVNGWLATLQMDVAGAEPYFRPVSVAAQPLDGETLPDAIRRVRGEIAQLKTELTLVRNAPPSREEIRAKVIAEVDALAKQGAPQVTIGEHGIRLRLADMVPFAANNAVLSAPSGSASALLAWLFRDRLLEALLAGVNDIRGGISAAERTARIADLDQQILTREHLEEAFIVEAIERGVEVHRRPTASPWALLGMEVDRSAVTSDVGSDPDPLPQAAE